MEYLHNISIFWSFGDKLAMVFAITFIFVALLPQKAFNFWIKWKTIRQDRAFDRGYVYAAEKLSNAAPDDKNLIFDQLDRESFSPAKSCSSFDKGIQEALIDWCHAKSYRSPI